jgi:hypothetical protein
MIPQTVTTLGQYLGAFSGVVKPGEIFWFRGHACYDWILGPSALRDKNEMERQTALGLVAEFKRFADFKLEKPPQPDEELKWWQVAQHYGIPTRLLDWTQNAAVALYFACQQEDEDGLVLVLNPADLNLAAYGERRVFDANSDAAAIKPYLKLGPKLNKRGKKTIAIHPTWNTERITIQQGAFTLHGSKCFELDSSQASSLCYLPILSHHKKNLLVELERMGTSEMTIFPEPEHVGCYLKRHHNLCD